MKADGQTRPQIIQIAELFRARVVDVSPHALTIEATGTPDKLEALRNLLEDYGLRELVRTGLVGLARGDRGITDRALRIERGA